MTSIDLIPAAYRTRRWQVQWFVRAGSILAGIFCVLAAGLAALGASTATARAHVEALQQQQEMSAQQRTDLERLSIEKRDLEQQFQILSGLRSGAAAEEMFRVVDRAMTGDNVWFVDWKFQRAGVAVGGAARAVNTGYFIIVADDAAQPQQGEFRVHTDMTIRGQASDHSALSGFVRQLFAQEEIDDVRIRRTNVNRDNKREVVDFDLAVVLKTTVREP